MTGPDHLGAGGRGHFRASHADREHVIDTLNVAFTDGRLDKDEFDARVGQALISRTYADLAPLTADLPVRPVQASPPRQRVRSSVTTATVRSLAAGFAVIPPIIFFEAIFTSDNANLAELFFPLMLLELIFLTLAAGNTLLDRLEDRRVRAATAAGAGGSGRLSVGRPAERHLH